MAVALIIGATGLVGVNLAARLGAEGRWRCIGVGRTPPADLQSCGLADFIRADLRDPDSLRSQRQLLQEVTHVFYLARVLGKDYTIPIRENVEMLGNVLDVIGDLPALEHVQVMHGLKWYGSHMIPFAIPARESDPRPQGVETFYYAQHDLIASRQQGKPWTYSTLRPHCVSGVAADSPSNLMLGLAVYAVLMRETGQALCYPGPQSAFTAALTYTDATLLADVMHWAAVTPAAANQDFNVANGDVFSWALLWPRLCEYFGVEAGPARENPDFIEDMRALAPVWSQICAKYDLDCAPYERMVDWAFVRASLGLKWDQVMSTEKLTEYGYAAQVDTASMVLRIFDQYRERRVLP